MIIYSPFVFSGGYTWVDAEVLKLEGSIRTFGAGGVDLLCMLICEELSGRGDGGGGTFHTHM